MVYWLAALTFQLDSELNVEVNPFKVSIIGKDNLVTIYKVEITVAKDDHNRN